MCKIAEIKKQIEEVREEVKESWGKEPYEVSYQKNLKLDKLIEDYLDALEESST